MKQALFLFVPEGAIAQLGTGGRHRKLCISRWFLLTNNDMQPPYGSFWLMPPAINANACNL